VGVWIETVIGENAFFKGVVTPPVGVWIETVIGENAFFKGVSHAPPWACGLKL
jgi:hypothetical protein